MKRLTGAFLSVGLLLGLTACGGPSKEEKQCRERYKLEQQAKGLHPSGREIRQACDKDGPARRHYYHNSSGHRGGGSGSGK